MKNCIKRFFFLCFTLFLVLASAETKNIFAQTGGGQSANLGNSISAEVSGKVGVGVFERLKKPVTKKTVTKKTQTTKTTKDKTSSVKGGKTGVRNKPVEIDDFDEYKILKYKPDVRLKTAEKLLDEFTGTPDERTLMIELFKAAKSAYDEEAAKKGKKNDVALALTFFLASCVTVHNDAPEPSDQAIDNLYDALSDSLIEDEQFAASTDREKQEMSETMIYIGGLVLGGYTIGKQGDDADTVEAFQKLAGISLSSLTKLDPDKMSFNKQGLIVNP
jgi:hypothetical protein